jgi:hypothetical protein
LAMYSRNLRLLGFILPRISPAFLPDSRAGPDAKQGLWR